MNPADFAVYAWLSPVVIQIVLPLIVLSVWLVIKLPMLLFGKQAVVRDAEGIRAG